MTKLLCIATIGRTGAEIILSELAQNPMIAMLPGQDFAGSSQVLYRPQDYRGLEPREVFEKLRYCICQIQTSLYKITNKK